MQGTFSNLDIELDILSIKKEYENKRKEFDSLPVGQYNGSLERLEPVLSSTGKPMIAIEFKVLDGTYQNRHYFYNFMINNGTGIYFAVKFLKSISKNMSQITFENYSQFEQLIENIKLSSLNQIYTFVLSKTQNNYDRIDII